MDGRERLGHWLHRGAEFKENYSRARWMVRDERWRENSRRLKEMEIERGGGLWERTGGQSITGAIFLSLQAS